MNERSKIQWGGRRAGAGRPKGRRNATHRVNKPRPLDAIKLGAVTRRQRAVARQYLVSGQETPLEIMLLAMRTALAAGDLDKAAAHAKDAAPFLHPRLGITQVTGANGGAIETRLEVAHLKNMSDEEVSNRLEAATARLAHFSAVSERAIEEDEGRGCSALALTYDPADSRRRTYRKHRAAT
jgi:hypothetical protein